MPRKPRRGKCWPVPSKVAKPTVTSGAIWLVVYTCGFPRAGLSHQSMPSLGFSALRLRKQLPQTPVWRQDSPRVQATHSCPTSHPSVHACSTQARVLTYITTIRAASPSPIFCFVVEVGPTTVSVRPSLSQVSLDILMTFDVRS